MSIPEPNINFLEVTHLLTRGDLIDSFMSEPQSPSPGLVTCHGLILSPRTISTEDEADLNFENFLATMYVLCYRTTSLIKDDVLCYFGFCQKGVQLEGKIGRAGNTLFIVF